jgi:hypothetical protein
MRRYRDSGSQRAEEYKDRERRRGIARHEALSALARKHPAEFAALYQAELEQAGLSPKSSGRPPRAALEVTTP